MFNVMLGNLEADWWWKLRGDLEKRERFATRVFTANLAKHPYPECIDHQRCVVGVGVPKWEVKRKIKEEHLNITRRECDSTSS